MATINIKTILGDFSTAIYDDATGIISLTTETGLTSDETIVNSLLTKIENSAKNKRTSLNDFISEQSTAPTPAITVRRNADNTLSETQIEKRLDLCLWYKQPDFANLIPVNESD